MRKLSVSILVAAIVAAFAPVGHTDAPVPAIARVHVHSMDEAAFVMNNFDETHNHSEDEIEILLWPGDIGRLKALGLEYEVTIPDLVAHDAALAAGPQPVVELPGPDRSDYRRLTDYNTEMADLADKNPGLVKLFEMKRPSLEGRHDHGSRDSGERQGPRRPADLLHGRRSSR